jgi:hypothetical protein
MFSLLKNCTEGSSLPSFLGHSRALTHFTEEVHNSVDTLVCYYSSPDQRILVRIATNVIKMKAILNHNSRLIDEVIPISNITIASLI